MKKFLCLFLSVLMIAALMPATFTAAVKTPGDYGWYTDGDNFSGWIAASETSFAADASASSERIWKPFLTDQGNFKFSVDITAGSNAYPMVIILGNTLEFDSRHGNGNQFYLKLNNTNIKNADGGDWTDAKGCKASLIMERHDGGDVAVTITGADNAKPVKFNMAAKQSNENIELKANRVVTTFSNISFTTLQSTPKTPGDFGWHTDKENDFTGWSATSTGVFTVDKSKTLSDTERIIKNLVEDTNNFEIKITVTANNNYSEASIRLFGKNINLNTRDGSGHQFYCSDIGDWVEADDGVIDVTLTRKDGGNISVSLSGKNQASRAFEFAVTEEDHPEVELKANVGTCSFSDISSSNPSDAGKTPADYGWYAEGNVFTGWSAESETSFTAQAGAGRIWKPALTNLDSFEVSLTVTPDTEGYPAIIILGNTLELDSRHGNGNEVYAKLNNNNIKNADGGDWLAAAGREVKITLARKDGGNITGTLTGAENAKPSTFTMEKKIDNENIELKPNGLACVFKDISIKCGLIETTPGDFGWKNDNGDFTGWSAANETSFSTTKGKYNCNRVWKELISDVNDFQVSAVIRVGSESASYIQILDQKIEYDTRHSNDGDEIYLKLNEKTCNGNDWMDATGNSAKITFNRKNGGDMSITITSDKGECLVIVRASTLAGKDSKNVEIGNFEGSLSVSEVTVRDHGEEPPKEDENSPGTYGWENESNNFKGWKASDGANLSAEKKKVSVNRVWKSLIDDVNNFTLTLRIKPGSESAAYLKIFEHTIEFDTRHSNDGNEAYYKLDGKGFSWIKAKNNEISVKAARKDGGKIIVEMSGVGIDGSPYYLEFDPIEEKKNVELGIYEGKASFNRISCSSKGEEIERIYSFLDYGWHNDTENFTGWTLKDEANFSVDRSKIVNHRVWKSLYPSMKNFSITADITPGEKSEAVIRIFGTDIQLDTRSSKDKDQVGVKLNGEFKGWVDTEGYLVHTMVARNGGDIEVTVTGKDETVGVVFTFAPAEDNENYELGINEGTAKYQKIKAGKYKASDVKPVTPAAEEETGNDIDPIKPVKPEDKPVVDTKGWSNFDEDYSGWTFTSESSLSVKESEANITKISKDLIENTENFALRIVVKPESGSEASVTVMGQKISFINSGSGIVKVVLANGEEKDVLTSDGKVNLTLARNEGGNIKAVLTGTGSTQAQQLELPVIDDTSNVELGIVKGEASFTSMASAADISALPAVEDGDPASGGFSSDGANIPLIIGCGAGALALIGTVIVIIKKKKKKSEK